MTAFHPIQCAECDYRGHILLTHVEEAHGMAGRYYQEKYPDKPLFSDLGDRLMRQYTEDSGTVGRQSQTMPVSHLLGWPANETFEVRRFLGRAPWVPAGDDEGFHYDYDTTLGLLYAFERSNRNAVWLQGYAGTGKTQLVLNLCRRLNREVVRVNLDSSITRSDLIGDWVVRDGATHFQHGLLPQAMRRGAVLLLDEYDLGNPYILALFRPVLELVPSLVILENGGERVEPHPDFRIVATANTWGNGDTSGLYGTTQSLSLADRQRFSLFLEMNYLKPAIEEKILKDAVPNLDAEEAESLVKLANAIRTQYAAGKIEESISPRQLINFAEVYDTVGWVLRAADLTLLRPMNPSSALAIRQLIADSGLCREGETDAQRA